MAKKLTIKEQIKRLEAFQSLIEDAERNIEYWRVNARDYYNQSTDEEGNVNENSYSYDQYLEYKAKADALEAVIEEISNLL